MQRAGGGGGDCVIIAYISKVEHEKNDKTMICQHTWVAKSCRIPSLLIPCS